MSAFENHNEKSAHKNRNSIIETVLLTLGAPIWFSLCIAVFAVIFSLFISFWAVIFSLWSIFVSLVASALGGTLAGVLLIIFGRTPAGIASIGVSLVSAGLSAFAFFGCMAATKVIALLTKKTALAIKKCFVRGECK